MTWKNFEEMAASPGVITESPSGAAISVPGANALGTFCN